MNKFRYFIHDDGIYEIVIDGEKIEIYGFAIKKLIALSLNIG